MSSQRRNNNRRGNRRRKRRRSEGPHFRSNPDVSFALVKQPNLCVPPGMWCSFRYADKITLTNTVGAYSYNVYRMNSLFDPDFSNGGSNHQPYGFDQLAALYTKYRVSEFTWNVTVVANSGSNSVAAISLTGSTGNPTSCSAQAEFPWSSMQVVPANEGRTFRGRIPLRQFLGMSQTTFEGDDSNEAVISANPTNICSFVIGSESVGNTTNTVSFALEFGYVAWMYQPYPMAQS